MDEREVQQRLSQITTRWSIIFQAHEGKAEDVSEAQRLLMQRYAGAVYRYLLAALRDANAADDLAQDFAVRFLRGDFRRADPERGRFRNFLKTALQNLIVDHYRRQKRQPRQIPEDAPEPAVAPHEAEELDRQFLESWRNELLTRAWEALAHDGEYYTVLHLRAEHPDWRSAQLAEKLTTLLHKSVTENWVRQALFRARKKFADYLLDDIKQSLEQPTPETVEEELSDLGLLEYVRPELHRRGGE